MGLIAAAAVGAIAVGGAMSAKGAADNAAAVGSANAQNAYEEDRLFKRQKKSLNNLISEKEEKLYNLGNIFDRFESTGAFGDTETLRNLRKAQEDFSALAAGDFTGFESQLRKTLSDSLINVVGSGAPVGTYAGLAADTQMQYRQSGLQTALGVTEFLSNEANKLLGSEFGIMDQRFNTMYELDRTKTTNKANYNLGEASTVGVGTQAFGQAIQSTGQSILSYGIFNQSQETQRIGYNNALEAARMAQPPSTTASVTPSYSRVPSYVAPTIPTKRSNISTPSTLYPEYYAPSINPFGYGSGYVPSPVPINSNQDPTMVLPPLLSSYRGLNNAGLRVVA